jgi:hypothetical protein
VASHESLAPDRQAGPTGPTGAAKPPALVVFLENVGHIAGADLPAWAMAAVDWAAEEYVKLALRVHGVHRRYDRVVVLEDEHAIGPELVRALLGLSRTHRIDLLLLAHGLPGQIVGYCGRHLVGPETFATLRAAHAADPAALDLRIVWQMNCYGASLVPVWVELGAEAVNGSVGVNWLPEPSLSLFLRAWLAGRPFSEAVARSNARAQRAWRILYRPGPAGREHPRLAGSRQTIAGRGDPVFRASEKTPVRG